MVLSVSTALERCKTASSAVVLRRPCATDGRAAHELIAACPPLDCNSLYLNLLQCTHFAETCVLAESTDSNKSIQGFVSGYRLPDDPKTLFIWQVAIAPVARGQGLARRMLLELLTRPACAATTHLQTTITPSNEASWALFRSLAELLQAPLEQQLLFDRDLHLDGVHESEQVVTIGPFAPQAVSSAA
jgi:L-2,4-diaminobutyric acid acetyltransferase